MAKGISMIGAIVGDIAGSRFEWHNRKSKRFTFLKGEHESRHPCRFTDDSVMTLAVADAIMKWREAGGGSYDALSAAAVTSMQEFGRRYPRAGYGGAFRRWLGSAHPEPYNSWGNGAAMRVSACGWAAVADWPTGDSPVAKSVRSWRGDYAIVEPHVYEMKGEFPSLFIPWRDSTCGNRVTEKLDVAASLLTKEAKADLGIH